MNILFTGEIWYTNKIMFFSTPDVFILYWGYTWKHIFADIAFYKHIAKNDNYWIDALSIFFENQKYLWNYIWWLWNEVQYYNTLETEICKPKNKTRQNKKGGMHVIAYNIKFWLAFNSENTFA